MSTVEAKFRVYKKYKDLIHNQHTFLHHEYDNNDDVSKLIAAYLVSTLFNLDPLMHLTLLRKYFDQSCSREQVLNVCSEVSFHTGLGRRNVNEIKKIIVNETITKVIMKIFNEFVRHFIATMHKTGFQSTFKLQESIYDTIVVHVSNEIHKQQDVLASVLPVDVNSMEWIEEVGDLIYMQITQDKEEIINKCLKIFDRGPIGLLLKYKEACEITNCKYSYILHLSKYDLMCQCFVKKGTVIESNTYPASYCYQY